MAHDSELDALRRQTLAEVQQDGLTQVAAGVFLVAVGAMLPLGRAGVVVVLLSPVLALVLERVRSRLTYPRVGYVRHTPPAPLPLLGGIIGYAVLVVLAGVAAWLVLSGALPGHEAFRRWGPLLLGVILSGGFHHAATQSGDRWWYLMVAASVGAGLYVSLWGGTTGYASIAHFCLVLGSALLVMGGAKLAAFLHTHSRLAEGGPSDDR